MGKVIKLPDFIIIGAAKAGTTSLAKFLGSHKAIFMSNPKEPCFFDENVTWSNGLDWYSTLFEDAKPGQICGEASTNYTRWPQVMGVPEKIFNLLPEARLIYLISSPDKRAYSHYVHRWTKETHRNEPFTKGFFEYIEEDPMCIQSSLYADQLDKFLDFFPKEQILPIVFERLLKDTHVVMKEIYNFLRLPEYQQEEIEFPHANDNQGFRQDMARLNYVRILKKNRGLDFISSLIPSPMKNLIYTYVIDNFKTVKERNKDFTPLPLTTEESDKLKKMFVKPNQLLKKEWSLDLSYWD